jgi:prevent-host-death family protein
MENRMSISELRDHLGRRIDAAHYQGEATVVEKNGEPRAVLVPYEWWQEACRAAPSEGGR